MKIANREIGTAQPPFIVAEIGAGWMPDDPLGSCTWLMRSAKKAGASAVKIQLYKPEDLTVEGVPPLVEGLWAGRTLWDIYQEGSLPEEIVPKLFEEAARLDIPLFASVFSPRAIPLLESLGCPAYKIAAPEVTHGELLEAVGATLKPAVISTGLAMRTELEAAVRGISNIALLHSVNIYPAPNEKASLGNLTILRHYCGSWAAFGLSDHSRGHTVAAMAVAMGAVIIEKHIGLAGSLDAGFALRPYELGPFVTAVNDAWRACQGGAGDGEISQSYLRRSVRTVRDIEAGEEFTRENIAVVRPNGGAHPREFTALLGHRARCTIVKGSPVDGNGWED